MNTITRAEKLEHASDNLTDSVGYYLNERFVERNPGLPDIQLHALETGAVSDSKLADFTQWLHEAPVAKDLSEGGATLKQALTAYRTALRHKLMTMKEWLPDIENFIDGRLERLAEDGHIPVPLRDRYREEGAASVDLRIADSSTGEKKAFYVPDTHIIYTRPWASKKALTSILVHEAFHGLSGTSSKKHGDALFTSRVGLGTHVVGERGYVGPNITRHRAINEGITEYLRNLVLYDLPGHVSPEDRGGKDTASYKMEREIVQVLADRVGLDTLLNAYAEDYEPGKPDSIRHTRELMRKIRKVYGPGFLHKLDKLDQDEGPERALMFVRAADYIADNRTRARTVGQKVGAVLGLNTSKH